MHIFNYLFFRTLNFSMDSFMESNSFTSVSFCWLRDEDLSVTEATRVATASYSSLTLRSRDERVLTRVSSSAGTERLNLRNIRAQN